MVLRLAGWQVGLAGMSVCPLHDPSPSKLIWKTKPYSRTFKKCGIVAVCLHCVEKPTHAHTHTNTTHQTAQPCAVQAISSSEEQVAAREGRVQQMGAIATNKLPAHSVAEHYLKGSWAESHHLALTGSGAVAGLVVVVVVVPLLLLVLAVWASSDARGDTWTADKQNLVFLLTHRPAANPL